MFFTVMLRGKQFTCHVYFCGTICLAFAKKKPTDALPLTSLTLYLSPTDKLSPDRVKLVMEHIWRMQEFCNSMTKLSPDSYEYAYLKAIVLFSPGALKTGQFTK